MKEIYNIKLLNHEYIDEQILVYRLSFNSQESYEETKIRWEKKHFCNPIHDSFIFGAFDGDRLVCINAFMPQVYEYQNMKLNVIQSCESGTLPKYRGKGVWSLVIQYAMNYFKKNSIYDFIFGFPNYDNSYRGFLKLGWKEVTEVKNLIMIGDGSEFLKVAGKKQLKCVSDFFSLQHISFKFFSKDSKYSFENDNALKMITLKENSKILLNVDQSFIQWKMQYKNLKLLNIFFENDLIATCYYLITNYENGKVILLFDILVRKDVAMDISKEIYATSIVHLLQMHKDIAFIRTWIVASTKKYELYKKMLFIKSTHHNPVIIYPLQSDHLEQRTLLDPNIWDNISFMNLD